MTQKSKLTIFQTFQEFLIFVQKMDLWYHCGLTYTFICPFNGNLSSEFMTHFLCIADAERSLLLPFDNFFARTICLLNVLRGKFPSLLKYARDVCLVTHFLISCSSTRFFLRKCRQSVTDCDIIFLSNNLIVYHSVLKVLFYVQKFDFLTKPYF